MFLFILVSFGVSKTHASSNFEENIINFLENPNEEFQINHVVQNDDLVYEIAKLVDNDETSWNTLKQKTEENNGELLGTVYFDNGEGSIDDFKIFTGIGLKKLSIYLEHENSAVLNSEYLNKLEELTIESKGNLKQIDLSGFKNLKVLNVDAKEYPQLTMPDSKKLERINLEYVHTNSLTLSSLSDLYHFRLEHSTVNNLTFKDLPKLASVYLVANRIKNLSMENISLYDFYYHGNEIDSLSINKVSGLEYLDLGFGSPKNLSVENSNDIEAISLVGDSDDENTQLKNIKLNNLPNLTIMSLTNTLLEDFEISKLPKLEHFEIYHSNIRDIDLSDPILSNLKTLILTGSQINKIDLSQVRQLKELNLRENNLKEINLSGFTQLVSLDVTGNKLTHIDLSGLKKLRSLSVSRNKLSTLDLKDQEELSIIFAYSNKFTSLVPFKDVLDTITTLIIFDNEINLLSKENNSIHKKLKSSLTGHNWKYGDHYQYDSQRVKQVEEKKSFTTKKKESKKTNIKVEKNPILKSDVIIKNNNEISMPLLNTRSLVTFPSNLAVGTELKISELDNNRISSYLAGTPFELAGDIFEFSLDENVKITEPFKLELSYDKEKYPSEKWDIAIYYYNEIENKWEKQSSKIDEKNGIVTANVNHFSIYGVLAKPKVDSGEILPNTATPFYNYMLIGLTFLIVGLVLYVLNKKQIN